MHILNQYNTIRDHMLNSQIQEEDPWLNQQVNCQQNIFKRININFSNDVINQNIDKEMEKPIYKRPIQDYNEDGEEIQQESQQRQNKKNKQKTQQIKQQALYNPLEDEQNEKWMGKMRKDMKKPLNCPACFNQIAYEYKAKQSNENNFIYVCREVFSCKVVQNKILRSFNVKQKMAWQGLQSEGAQQKLRQREQQINIKILVQCECGYELGYYDINNENYVILNGL